MRFYASFHVMFSKELFLLNLILLGPRSPRGGGRGVVNKAVRKSSGFFFYFSQIIGKIVNM